jgi:dCTP deaminase
MLSNVDILTEIDRGNIVCQPFNQDNLSNSSIDLRLGDIIYKQRSIWWRKLLGIHTVKFDVDDNGKVAVNNPAETIEWMFSEHYIGNEDVYILKPGEFILASTLEYVGSNCPWIVCDIADKSTFARLGLSICFGAGHVEAGNALNVTLEIKNNGNLPIELQYGQHICQAKFMYLNTPSTKPYEGKYLNSTMVEVAK